MSELARLHAAIDARVGSIRDAHPDWPCSRGCDRCCRSLAAEPRLSAAEWQLLQTGLAALPADRLAAIAGRIAVLAAGASPPVVCPLLDRESGACPVYPQRPVACRSYGFYVQRGVGLHCDAIEAAVGEGRMAGVVWGNHEVIDRELAGCGETRRLSQWFAQRSGCR